MSPDGTAGGAAATSTEGVLAMLQEVAAEVVTPRFRALDDGDVTEKNPGDLVTVADREAEEIITARLREAFPGAMVLGEEAVAADASLLQQFAGADHAFTVDPVDGTKNFVKGSPDHAVMAAELRGGQVVRSWIWQPQHERAYVAERGAGAWRNGERLHRPDRAATRQEDLRGVTSRRSWIGRAVGTMRDLELTWVCCGVDYPKLVEGAADYALFAKSKPWDHAPGQLLLTEAGGFVGTFDGEPYAAQDSDVTGATRLVAAGDRETYDLVQGLVRSLPGS